MGLTINHRAKRFLLTCALCVVVLFSNAGLKAVTEPAGRDRTEVVAVQSAVQERLVGLDAPGVTGAISRDGAVRAFAAGHRDESGRHPMRPGDRMRLASVTKLYLAAVVLQLVDEGKLDLNDSISEYVQGVPNGEHITLRMLGRHTSGLDDAIRQMAFHEAIAREPARIWTPAELMRYAFEPGPRHEPGEVWAYSNINSLLLALAVQRATGTGWRDHVRQRILEPLALNDTGFADLSVVARGYRYGKTDDPVSYGGENDHRWFDATGWSPSWTNAAGEMTGTAADTARFIATLFGGDLVSRASRAALTDFAPTQPGGDFLYGLHCHRIGSGYGHHGDVPGYSSSAVWLPESNTAIVVLSNLSAELDKRSSASKLMSAALAALADQEVATQLEQIVEATAIQEAAAVVIREGQAGAPIGDAARRYRIGSVSKLLTALLVLRAQEAGVLNLEDPVATYLPGVLTGDGADEVSLANLLEHTSGLAGSGPSEYAAHSPGLDPLQYVAQHRPFKLRWRPGLHYSYSNPGCTLAAAVVEKAWGGDFDELMRREVFEPLGMADTTFDAASPPSYHADGSTLASPWAMPVRPAGSAVSTASDMAKVVEMLVQDGGDFLPAESIARLERGETGLLADAGGGRGSYGLGSFAYAAGDQLLRAHWGKTEGFRATLAYDPQGATGYVLLVDTAADPDVHRLRRLLNDHVTRDLPEPEPPPSIGSAPHNISGLYVNHSHDGAQRGWLFALLDARRLTPTPNGLEVDPLWQGPPTSWTRVGDALYQARGLPVASGATATVNGIGYWIDGESYRRVPAWAYWCRVIILMAGLAASLLAVAVLAVMLIRLGCHRLRLRSANRPAMPIPPFALFAVAGIAYLMLLIGFVHFQLGDLETIAQIGRVSPASLMILVASLTGPTATAAGLMLLWPYRRRRISMISGLTLALPLACLAILLATAGMVPSITWMS